MEGTVEETMTTNNDYKVVLSEVGPLLLEWSQDLDNRLIPTGVCHPVATKLRILAAQFAGDSQDA